MYVRLSLACSVVRSGDQNWYGIPPAACLNSLGPYRRF